MKKDNLSKKLTYKESINRYDVEFIYKGKIRLLFMLPTTEKDYAEALLEAEGTAGVKDNKAVLASSEEIVVELLYELISNLLKTKLDELHRLTDTLKSILMSRMQEAKFLNIGAADYIPPTTNGIKNLNNM